jgi:hypothetical protein
MANEPMDPKAMLEVLKALHNIGVSCDLDDPEFCTKCAWALADAVRPILPALLHYALRGVEAEEREHHCEKNCCGPCSVCEVWLTDEFAFDGDDGKLLCGNHWLERNPRPMGEGRSR